MKTAHLQIAGKVQGVFFRAKAKEIAEIHKVSGWIRNTDDGKVEACISGEDTAVEEFILWCKDGPEKAKVEDVLVNYIHIKRFDRFEVIR
jgi:acylphosphatase